MRETGLTSASKSMITARLNDYYSQIIGEKDWKWLEHVFDRITVADQESYDLNVKNIAIKSIYLQRSAIDKSSPLRAIRNPEEWDTLNNTYINSSTDYPSHFHIRSGRLFVFPKVATSGYTIKIVGTENPDPLEVEDYSTGSIAVTNGDETVTGTGTAWNTYAKAGAMIKIERVWYEVASVTSDTALELTQKFDGTTKTGITDYKIGDAPRLPENAHSILWKMFCEEYFAKNPSGAKGQLYERMVVKQRLLLDKVSDSPLTSHVWDNNGMKTGFYTRDPYTVYSD